MNGSVQFALSVAKKANNPEMPYLIAKARRFLQND